MTRQDINQALLQTSFLYGGNGAYVALYLLDGAGKYKGTLWMAGDKTKFYRHLSDWTRASGGRLAEVDGITGASVGSGKTLKITVDIADALIASLRRKIADMSDGALNS